MDWISKYLLHILSNFKKENIDALFNGSGDIEWFIIDNDPFTKEDKTKKVKIPTIKKVVTTTLFGSDYNEDTTLSDIFLKIDLSNSNDTILKDKILALLSGTDILNKLLTVDGSGSNLDADKLDGIEGNQFARKDIAETFQDNVSIRKDLTVYGKTVFQGDVFTVNKHDVYVSDNFIVLNSGQPSGLIDAGIEIDRGSETHVKLFWDETHKAWKITTNTDTEHIIATTNEIADAVAYLLHQLDSHNTDINAPPGPGGYLPTNPSGRASRSRTAPPGLPA